MWLWKISLPTQGRASLNSKEKDLKSQNWIFQRNWWGRGFKRRPHIHVGGVWIFFGTIQWCLENLESFIFYPISKYCNPLWWVTGCCFWHLIWFYCYQLICFTNRGLGVLSNLGICHMSPPTIVLLLWNDRVRDIEGLTWPCRDTYTIPLRVLKNISGVSVANESNTFQHQKSNFVSLRSNITFYLPV